MSGAGPSFVRANGITLHYRVAGNPAGPPLLLVNSLGTDLRIWDEVIALIGSACRIVSYDKRGHGLSDAPPGPYGISDHVADLVGLVDHLGIGRFALAGVSVGGLIAQAVAARHADRIAALVLCDTAAQIGTAASWNDRMTTVMAGGTEVIADALMERWFSAGFRQRHPVEVSGWRNMLVRTDRNGYAATCATLRDTDLTEEVRTIPAPTLAVAGTDDTSIPPQRTEELARSIPGARYEAIPGAGHLPSIEQPAMLADLMRRFFNEAGYG